MIIYPAIDVMGGRCVRLMQGQFSKETVYADNPVEIALKWESIGSRYLHVIDLDGARTGKPLNAPVIIEMAAKLGIPIQLGGGIRSMETIGIFISKGVERVILGTSAVRNAEFAEEALKVFNDNIAVAIDAKEGMVAIEGWAKTSEFTSVGFAKKIEKLGARTIIYTDISRDGMLSGPNFKAIEEMVKAVDMEVIASGGVSSLEDIKNLKSIGVSGVVIGKALYTGDINLEQALEAAE